MIGLEISLQQNISQQTSQNPHQFMQQPQQPTRTMIHYGHQEADHLHHSQGYRQYAAKIKNQISTLSDDDDAGVIADKSADDGKRLMSPAWRRVKWTDHMVKLLIMVVYYIGDHEAGSEGNDPSGKKKCGGVLQKKGKWKSVSRAMMERGGFYVSPQQCEDKFNDLNKRYKRVNDILGKGTACRVVENQALLEKMDHLTSKMKEEVKKLMNSKHLFFREMCAYHNICNHGGAQQSPEVTADPSQAQQQSLQLPETQGSRMAEEASSEDDYDGEDDDEDGEDVFEGGARSHEHDDDESSRKRRRKEVFVSPLIQELSNELMNVIQDGTKNSIEKRVWMKTRIVQLEEQHLAYRSQAIKLEKQRLKWRKFSGRKEKEMERERLSNERMSLENERMVLLIRQKEFELLNLQQNKKTDPCTITG